MTRTGTTEIICTQRGGRLTKYKGMVASIAPHFGGVRVVGLVQPFAAVLTLAGGTLLGTTALAGSCVETSPGVWSCSGASSLADVTQIITTSDPGGLTITTDPGFGVNASTFGPGMVITSSGGSIDLTDTNDAEILGYDDGVYINNTGTGTTTITTSGEISGVAGDGVDATSVDGSQTLTLGEVYGYYDGVYVAQYGTGDVNLTTNGTVSGSTVSGIHVYGGTSGSVTITANDSVSGGTYGVLVFNSSGTDTTITTTDVDSGDTGIDAFHQGTGTLSITSTGTVTGNATDDAEFSFGVLASTCECSDGLTISTNNVSGAQVGIDAYHDGSGMLSITSTGVISTTTSAGLDAHTISYNESYVGYGAGVVAVNNGSGLSIDVGSVYAFGDGILTNSTSGATTITATGTISADSTLATVYSGTHDGIDATSMGTDLTISVATVSGTDDGIDAQNNGTGALTITATGLVSGGITGTSARFGSGNGIEAYNGYSATDMTISVASVQGNDEGIDAYNLGTGDVTITATGSVEGGVIFESSDVMSVFGLIGRSNAGEGIQVLNGPAGGNVSITAVDVSGYGHGINVTNNGTGSTDITTTGTVTGGASTYDNALPYAGVAVTEPYSSYPSNLASGIDVVTGATTTSTTITAVDVHGGMDGIYVEHGGTGAVTVTTTGTVTGGPGGYTTPLDTVFRAATEYETDPGLPIMILPAIGPWELGDGIDVANQATGTDITISANTVSAFGDGIYASNVGTGALTITATGTVTGGLSTDGVIPEDTFFGFFDTSQNGISAYTGAYTTDLTVSAVDVSGADVGILATHSGSGTLSITSTGAVTGTEGVGIVGQNSGTGDTVIQAVDASGYYVGVVSTQFGTGDNTVSVTGSATGDFVGVAAIATQGDLTITVADTTGGLHGIQGNGAGDGNVTVTSTGTATGTTANGIYVTNGGYGAVATAPLAADTYAPSYLGDVTVTSNNATGGVNGILANNYGPGSLSITTMGTTTGTSGTGILANNTEGDIDVTASTTVGGTDGIVATASGTGSIATLDITGDVSGTTGTGINVVAETSSVTLAGVVTGGNGTAIDLTGVSGAASVTVNDGFGVVGDLITNTDDGDDHLSLDTTTDFALDLTSIGNASASSGIIGFDTLSVDGTGTWTASGAQTSGAFDAVNLNNGTFVLDGADLLTNGSVSVSGMSTTLGVNGMSSISGSLSLMGGILDMQDEAAGDALTISGDFAGDGTVLEIDVDFAAGTADTVNIEGDVSGSTLIDINAVTSVTAGDESNITLITVGEDTDLGDFALTEGSEVSVGTFTYDLELDEVESTWDLVFTGVSSTGVAYVSFPGSVATGVMSLPQVGVANLIGQVQGNSANPGSIGFGRPVVESKPHVWVKGFGARAEGTQSDATTPYSYDTSVTGLQIGTRLWHTDTDNGEWTVAGFVDTVNVNSDVTSSSGTAGNDGSGVGVGIAGVWLANAGHYFGASAQFGRQKYDVFSSADGVLVTGHRTNSATLRIEGGYQFTLNETTTITPTATLTYDYFDGGTFTDSVGNVVELGTSDRWTASIGAKADFVLESGTELFASGSVTHELSSDNDVTVNSVVLDGGDHPTQLEIKFGVTHEVNERTKIFVEGGYGHDVGSGATRETMGLNLGFRTTW